MNHNGEKPKATIEIHLFNDNDLSIATTTKNWITAFGMLELAKQLLISRSQRRQAEKEGKKEQPLIIPAKII